MQLQQHLIMMNAVCQAFPQEWPAMIPILEYLYFTAPRSAAGGLSAHDISSGFALLSSHERALAPFKIPRGMAETEVAGRLFKNFAELYQVFSRVSAEEAAKHQDEINRKRTLRVFGRGEIVFRRLPAIARPAKHPMSEPSSGPYIGVDQRSLSSAVLMDPHTGQLLNGGASIPMDQLLAGPRRSKVEFKPDEESDVRSLGQMLRREGGAPPAPPLAGGLKGVAASRRRGWTGLGRGSYVANRVGPSRGPLCKELIVGKVLRNY